MNFQFAHLIWRSPQYPSCLSDPEIDALVAARLMSLSRTSHFGVLDARFEDHHLDLLFYHRDPAVLELISRDLTETLQRRLDLDQRTRPPLYFLSGDRSAFECQARRLNIPRSPLPSGYQVCIRPRGAHSRWVFQIGQSRLWAQRRVHLLYRRQAKAA